MTARAPLDTTPDAFDALIDRWRTMSPLDRARLADRLSVDIATIAKAGIRVNNPDIGEMALVRELARRRYGAAIADAAFRRFDEA